MAERYTNVQVNLTLRGNANGQKVTLVGYNPNDRNQEWEVEDLGTTDGVHRKRRFKNVATGLYLDGSEEPLGVRCLTGNAGDHQQWEIWVESRGIRFRNMAYANKWLDGNAADGARLLDRNGTDYQLWK
jgi:hypothetical protein